MPESQLFETVTFFTGPGRMDEVPLIDILWLMLMDSVHHRGQLSVYVRMAGGKVPVDLRAERRRALDVDGSVLPHGQVAKALVSWIGWNGDPCGLI